MKFQDKYNSDKRHQLKNEHNLNGEPNWEEKCKICSDFPIVPRTGLCGPCTIRGMHKIQSEEK